MSFIINPYVFAAAGGGGGPQPSDLSGLEVRLKASAVTGLSDNDQIPTSWVDSSGNSRDFTSTTLGTVKPRWRSSLGPNSQPTVRLFDQGYFQRSATFLSGFTAGEMFAVVKIDNDPPATNAKSAPPLGNWGSSFDEYYPFPTDSTIYDGFGSSARKTTTNPTTALTNWLVYNVRSASGNWTRSINAATSGNDYFNTGTNTVAWGGTGTILIGGSTSGSKTMEGFISDVIMYSRVLDDATERKAVVHQYLNDTYGFSLPTS